MVLPVKTVTSARACSRMYVRPAVVDGVELDDAVEVDVSDPRADNSHWRQYHQPRWEHGERASAGGAIVADVGTVQPPDGPPG